MKESVIVWQPQPKQFEFLCRDEYEALYGGSAGGGKSDALVIEATRQVDIPHYKGLILRKTFPQLTELIEKSFRYYPAAFSGAKYNDSKHTWTFPSGAQIVFGSMQHASDRHNYQGKAYDFIAFDELTHFTKEEYIYMLSRNRPNGPGTRCYMRATANPGGVGHAWVKERFIDPAPPGTTIWEEVDVEIPGVGTVKKKSSRVFIKSSVFDNKILLTNSPEYLVRLASLPEAEKMALLYGDWNAFIGRFFGEFREDTHVVEPFPIPKHWRRYRAIDYGLDMLAVLWIAVDELGFEYVYRELHESDMIASEAAKRIVSLSVDENGEPEDIERTFAPPDLWSRTKDSGRDIAGLFAENGVRFTKASPERIAGWQLVKEHLRNIPALDGEKTLPRLRVFRSCYTLIKHLQMLEFDEKRVSDAATEPHEITHICLSGNTEIRTPKGIRRLADMPSCGDVYAFDGENMVVAAYDSLGITQEDAPVYEMELEGGEIIRATEDHPFLTLDGYVPLELLSEGDLLINADGGTMEILRIDYAGCETVYNMAVDDYHNMVTAGGVVTHNCDALRYYSVMRPLPASPVKTKTEEEEWLERAKKQAIFGKKKR